MNTVAVAVSRAVARLRAAGVPDPGRDARLLMAHALGLAPDRLSLALPDPLEDAARDRFERVLAERLRRRPVAQIVGRKDFWNTAFEVTSDVLAPRPATEHLVALALAGPAPARVLDLGTGSGAILLSILQARPEATGLGLDLSAAALAVAQRNAAALGLAGRAVFRQSDWFDALTPGDGRFDLVVSNPPYIPAGELATLEPEVRDWEPALALSPGAEGLEAYRRIAADLDRWVAPGGRVLLEFGPGQGAAILDMLARAGFPRGRIERDVTGLSRTLSAMR